MTPKHLIVMAADGQFTKLARQNQHVRVGEEIVFPAPGFRWKKAHGTLASVFVAAIFFAIIVFSGIGSFVNTEKQLIAAYVTVDINPSVEFGIDTNEIVIEARGLNDDGRELMKFIEYQGRNLEDVSIALITQADQQHYLTKYLQEHEGSILITSTVVDETFQLNVGKVTEKVEQSVKHVLRDKHPTEADNFAVTALPAPKELRDAALNKGISTGKLAIELLAQAQGSPISTEVLKELSIHEAAKEFGGVGKLIQANKTKDKLKQLLQQEQKEQKEQKKQKNNGNDGHPSKKDKNKHINKGKGENKQKVEEISPPDVERKLENIFKKREKDRNRKVDKEKDRGKGKPKNEDKESINQRHDDKNQSELKRSLFDFIEGRKD